MYRKILFFAILLISNINESFASGEPNDEINLDEKNDIQIELDLEANENEIRVANLEADLKRNLTNTFQPILPQENNYNKHYIEPNIIRNQFFRAIENNDEYRVKKILEHSIIEMRDIREGLRVARRMHHARIARFLNDLLIYMENSARTNNNNGHSHIQENTITPQQNNVERINIDFLQAVQNNRLDLVVKYLRRGANVNFTRQQDGGWTALMIASYNNYYEIAEILLKNGANKNIRHKSGATALGFAFEKNQYDVARFLLINGANPYEGSFGRTAINEAHKQQNPKMIRLLKQYIKR